MPRQKCTIPEICTKLVVQRSRATVQCPTAREGDAWDDAARGKERFDSGRMDAGRAEFFSTMLMVVVSVRAFTRTLAAKSTRNLPDSSRIGVRGVLLCPSAQRCVIF